MFHLRFAMVLVGSAAVLLAGCGGGGGGGVPAPRVGPAPPSSNPAPSSIFGATQSLVINEADPANVAVVDRSTAVGGSATITGGAGTAGNTLIGSLPSSAGITVSEVLANGTQISETADLQFQGVSTSADDSVYTFVNAANTKTALLSRHSEGGITLNSTQYGIFATTEIGSLDDIAGVGIFSGDVTPVNQVPTTTTATYQGGFVGTDLGAENGILGDSSITANFGAGTISGQIDNIRENAAGGAGASRDYGLAISGNITGNTYQGTASFTDASGNAAGSVQNSGVNGAFFGSNAAETAGALSVSGQAPDGTGGTGQQAVVGGFGGARQ